MTATRTLPSPVESRPGRSWSALAVLMIGTFMFVLDFFIVNVALPSIRQGLGAGEGAIEWIVAGYAISTAVLLVTGGRLGDQFGRRRIFATGMTVFVLTSAACALAPDPAVLVAARILQGVGAALMAPNILSILGVVYSGPARVRAISVYGMVMGLAAVSGQLIGGVLIRADLAGLGWRAIFWINVPLGVAALLASPRLVPESRASQLPVRPGRSRPDHRLPGGGGAAAGRRAAGRLAGLVLDRARLRCPARRRVHRHQRRRPTAAGCRCSTRGCSPGRSGRTDHPDAFGAAGRQLPRAGLYAAGPGLSLGGRCSPSWRGY